MNAGVKYKCAWCGMPYEWFPIVSELPRDSIMNTIGYKVLLNHFVSELPSNKPFHPCEA